MPVLFSKKEFQMTILRLAFYFLLIVYLCSLTYTLASDYQENATRSRSSFIIWIIDTIDLFIHETGHLVFRIFGRFIEFLGGSLFQIMIPVAAIIVFARSTFRSLPFTLYWAGQSIVNVSIYIGDAPYLRLHLISKAAIHDWQWILNHAGMMEYAGDIAGTVNIFGLFTCCIGIGIGCYFVIKDSLPLFFPNRYPPSSIS
jgi:hypothetical protein